jgi:phage shock protein A
MAEDNINLVRTDVEILKKDVSNIQGLLTRLDTAIDKIADATNGIASILAVHDSKHNDTDKVISEMTRVEEKAIELIHQRISEKEAETRELSKQNMNTLMDFLKEHDDRSEVYITNMTGRIEQLERWKWIIMGGAWGIGVMIGFETELIMEYFSK